MSSVVEPQLRRRARAPREAGTARREAKTRSSAQRARLGGGIVWIVLLAALLAGVVAVNVAVLQLNVELDRLGHERARLKADIATTKAQLSTASARARIAGLASQELGLIEADPALTTYVQLGSAK